MEYRYLGETGVKVSNLSFGASSLGGVFHAIKEAEAIETVHVAVDNGINLIDVSPYYGNLKAEMVLGKALKEIARDKYYLSTKVGRYWSGNEKTWDYSASRVIQSVDESLTRLGIDYIDFIHCHDIEFADREMIIRETIPALYQLKESGKVRFVGITGLPLEELKRVVERSDSGMINTIITFCHYSLNDDALLDYLSFFNENRVGIINAAPLSMGLLSGKGVPDWHPADPEVIRVCQKAADYCRQQGEHIEKLAIQYAVNNPDVPTTLVSTSNPVNIINNIQWVGNPVNEELLQEVLAILKPINRRSWQNS